MKRVLLLLEDFVEESEFLYPLFRFKEEGFDVVVAAPELKECKGKNCMKFKPDTTIDNVSSDDFSIVYIPGGYAPDRLRRNKKILSFIKEMYEKGKIVATICHGPWVLISSGIIKGKTVTGYHAIKDDIINAGANYTGNSYEKDGNIFTARDPNSMPEYFPFLFKNIENIGEQL